MNDENLEVLQEVTIRRSDRYNMLIEVNPTEGTNFFYDPYFKVYLNRKWRAADKVARISLLRPEYVIHYNGRDHVNLSSAQIGFLKVILKENMHNNPNSITVWKYMCETITDIAKSMNISVNYKDIKMPPYENLVPYKK